MQLRRLTLPDRYLLHRDGHASETYRCHPDGGNTDAAINVNLERDAIEPSLSPPSGALTLDDEAVQPRNVAPAQCEHRLR